LRTSTHDLFGVNDFVMYGPVAGSAVRPMSPLGVPAGTAEAIAKASL
jgi:hypothetical protein